MFVCSLLYMHANCLSSASIGELNVFITLWSPNESTVATISRLLKPGLHQQQRQSNIVEVIACCFDIVAGVDRVLASIFTPAALW